MAKILFLSHRIPFPPDKGDKIRAFHILRRLTANHEVWLGAPVDDAIDLGRVEAAAAGCAGACLPALGAMRRGLNMASGLLSGAPLSVARFRHPVIDRWIGEVLRDVRPDLVFVYSSALAQHLMDRLPADVPMVVDFVDADAAKWQAYAQTAAPPMRWVFAREARRLVTFERDVLARAAAGLVITEPERQVMARLQPEGAHKLTVMSNGVELGPEPEPMPHGPPRIVMCGRMDYRANVDGAAWFAREVLPLVQAAVPAATFRIVGAAPTRQVLDLAALPGVTVTGAVPEVRPQLDAAHVIVAPLRVARGIQNKVLEGMAAGRPVVATPGALEGIAAQPGVEVLQADGAVAFAGAVLDVIQERAPGDLGKRGRRFVERRHRWDAELRVLERLVADLAPDPSAEAAA
jgi:sugar transferase (PEP-CTERM/EpsH1 system associated)